MPRHTRGNHVMPTWRPRSAQHLNNQLYKQMPWGRLELVDHLLISDNLSYVIELIT